MKRFYLSFIIVVSFAFQSIAQFTHSAVKVIDDLPKSNNSNLNKKSFSNPKACERDTVEYPRYKASRLIFINMRKGYSLGQFYSTRGDITISGFTFYAYVNTSPPSDSKVKVICNLYKAGSDSLPTGSPLRTDTITVDTTLGGGLLSNVTVHANFDSPITINHSYILTVESDTSINTSIVANDWVANDGEGMNFLCGTVSGRWYRGLSLNIGGNTLDADILLHPHVDYKFGTNFTFKDCSDMKDTVKFKNSYKSNFSGDPIYNRYSYLGYDWFCHQWNYGDNNFGTYQIEGAHKYAKKDNYKVRLISRIFQYHLTNGATTICTDTTIHTILYKPSNPIAVSNTNICRGDSANIQVMSDVGAEIRWYKNPVDTQAVFIGNLYRLGIPQKNDTFYIRAINNACLSNFTTLIVRVQDYPSHPLIKNDSICTGARANLGAMSTIGTSEWFTDTTKLPFFNGNILQTSPLTQDLSYYVRANNTGCLSPHFLKVTAFVDNSFAPDDPIVSNDTIICLRPTGEANLKAYNSSNDTIRWYDVASGGKSIATGNNYKFAPSSKGLQVIYVEARKSTCASSRLPIKITTSDYPSIPNIFPDTKCKGDTATIGVLLSDPGQVNWYLTATGGKSIDMGNTIRHFTTNTKSLYAEASENGCINPQRTEVKITINTYDPLTDLSVPLLCGSQAANLKASAGNSTVKWYEDMETTKLVGSGSNFTTPVLLVSTNYYFTLEKDGCVSPINNAFVEILPLPIPGFKDTIISGHRLRLTPYTGFGVSYDWDMGDGTQYTTKFVTHSYALYGTYPVKLKVTFLSSGCADSMIQNVVFDFSGIKRLNPNLLTIQPNPNSGTFVIKIGEGYGDGDISILSMDGRLVYHKSLRGETELEISKKLASGNYTVRFDLEKGSSYKRLLVN